MRRALITGVGGMDGSHLADLLLGKGYEVYGLQRRSARGWPRNIAHLMDETNFHVLPGDMTDAASLLAAVQQTTPDEVYNLAAQSFVGASWGVLIATAEATALGAGRLYEAVRTAAPDARLYQASSSEMFGNQRGLLDETAPLHPRSPYGVAKVFAHQLAVNFRESYDMHVSCGILFNHESPRRGEEFVTRKIARGVAAIEAGQREHLTLGNLEAQRDWGWAPDYVEAMWLMLQQNEPDDYVIATGIPHSVRDFAAAAFDAVDRDWSDYVLSDPSLMRPAEIDCLRGDASKARERFGWEPTVSFPILVKEMVAAELRAHDLELAA